MNILCAICYLSIGSNCPLCAKKIYLASISTIFRLDFGYNNMFFVVHVFQYKRVQSRMLYGTVG